MSILDDASGLTIPASPKPCTRVQRRTSAARHAYRYAIACAPDGSPLRGHMARCPATEAGRFHLKFDNAVHAGDKHIALGDDLSRTRRLRMLNAEEPPR